MFRILLLCLLVAPPASALAIYKCESDGRVLYSDTQCRGGKLLALREPVRNNPPASPTKINAEVEQARLQGSRLENERLLREAAQQAALERVALDDYLLTKKCAALALRKRWADEEAQLASNRSGYDDSGQNARRIARAVNEKYEAQCAG
jgi:hypothetical protein